MQRPRPDLAYRTPSRQVNDAQQAGRCLCICRPSILELPIRRRFGKDRGRCSQKFHPRFSKRQFLFRFVLKPSYKTPQNLLTRVIWTPWYRNQRSLRGVDLMMRNSSSYLVLQHLSTQNCWWNRNKPEVQVPVFGVHDKAIKFSLLWWEFDFAYICSHCCTLCPKRSHCNKVFHAAANLSHTEKNALYHRQCQ